MWGCATACCLQVDPSTGHTFYIHSVTGDRTWLPTWIDTVDPESGYTYYTNSEVCSPFKRHPSHACVRGYPLRL